VRARRPSWLIAAVCLVAASQLAAQPRLAVVIVVDQMRADYLAEYGSEFDGGFRRLTEHGAVFSSAYHDHALTETSPGHSTIVTGVFPSRHGVIGNEIWDRGRGELMNTVIDPETAMVGAQRRSGRSPWRLERTAIGDWLKASSPRSKVFGVSLKDRSAVFLAGQRPDGAYWYDERAGTFVTSSFYRDALPEWVIAFNATEPVKQYFGQYWSPLDTGSASSRPDRWGRGSSDDYPTFPHAMVGDGESPDRRFYTRFRLTPFADLLTLEFTERLIEAEHLGDDDDVDLLLIGLSASDYIGHRYGPGSAELRDHYLRLDDYLGDFFEYLDERIGEGGYLTVLSSDHGALPVPERLAEHGDRGSRIHWDTLLEQLEPVVARAQQTGVVSSLPTLHYEFGVIFEFGDVAVSQSEVDALADIVATQLNRHPLVLEAFTHKQMREHDDRGSPWFDLYARSFYPTRAPDVIVHVREDNLITDRPVGTTHVSPHEYDRHVPLIFAGAGIAAGQQSDAVRTADIAPTLAALLGIGAPADLDGRDFSRMIQDAR